METITEKKAMLAIHALATRALEIRQAVAASPGMEIGAAFKKWKTARGESAEMLVTADATPSKKALQELTARLRCRPCTGVGCGGTQVLESICSGCVEGRAGYKTKWTCNTCMHRDLSKEATEEWIIKLSTS